MTGPENAPALHDKAKMEQFGLPSSRAMLQISVSMDDNRDLRIVTYAVAMCVCLPCYETKCRDYLIVLPPSRAEG